MVSVIQLSDLHLLADPHEKLGEVNTQATLEAVLAMVKQRAPDVVVMTGDLTQEGELPAYQRLAKSVATLPCPVYWLPGNHDDIENARAGLIGGNLRSDTSAFINGWHFIFLDSTAPGLDDGFLSTRDLEHLHHLLHLHPDAPTLIFMHHPPIPIGCYMDEVRLLNEDVFLALVQTQPQIRAVLFGHVHQVFESKQKHIAFLSAPATAMQFAPNRSQFAIDDSTAPGYRWLKLSLDGQFTTGIDRITSPHPQHPTPTSTGPTSTQHSTSSLRSTPPERSTSSRAQRGTS